MFEFVFKMRGLWWGEASERAAQWRGNGRWEGVYKYIRR